ncbi:MAG: AAA family ATPase [Deltaproteobacteria bacterium]|jgi:hypothetical protein|nr:AAA family ATPase [Deltaproteobacteria bacterium]
MTLKQLPIANQSFAEIIDQNLLYVDKTRFIYELVKSPSANYFFLRPSGFGKTLLVSTLEELFSGNRERFQGLWIGQSDYDFPKIPVIKLSLDIKANSPADLKKDLENKVKQIAQEMKLNLKGDSHSDLFKSLIKQHYRQNNNTKVAVLIDDYDAGFTYSMGGQTYYDWRQSITIDYSRIVGKFINVLTESREYIRFILVTGIFTCGLDGLYGLVPHLNNISFDSENACLCGFTLEEFEAFFSHGLETTLIELKKSGQMEPSANLDDLRAEIIRWYGGYNFDTYDLNAQTRVLNPFSTINFFENKSFSLYWGKSKHIRFIIDMIKTYHRGFLYSELSYWVNLSEINQYDLRTVRAEIALFYLGYLSLNDVKFKLFRNSYDRDIDRPYEYLFGFPNHEARLSYFQECFRIVFGQEPNQALKTKGEELQRAFLSKDGNMVTEIFSSFLCSIGYRPEARNEEALIQRVLLLLDNMGFCGLSQIDGPMYSSALGLALPGKVKLIINAKYQTKPIKPDAEKDQRFLVKLARYRLSQKEIDEGLAESALANFSREKIDPIFRLPVKAERIKGLVKLVKKTFSEAEQNKFLAQLALEKISPERIDDALEKYPENTYSLAMAIEHELTNEAIKALNEIDDMYYDKLLTDQPKEIIALGLAVYSRCKKLKALFGKEQPSCLVLYERMKLREQEKKSKLK